MGHPNDAFLHPVGAAAGCDLLIVFEDQKIAACGSSYRDYQYPLEP
jgi:hypothetical protein